MGRMRKEFFGSCFALLFFMIAVTASPVGAASVSVFDKPLTYFLQLSQTASYGWQNDFDTYTGIRQALTTGILEGDYAATNNLKLYSMFTLTGDWAYPINHGSDTWQDRQFDQSSDNLAIDTEYWRILREIHITWKSQDIMLRAGKQIVSWGQLYLMTVLDQINPSDQYRGIADLQVETTKLPTWMARADFTIPFSAPGISDLNLQIVYDPNVDNDIYTHGPEPGNEVGGVWSPWAEIGPGVPVLGPKASLMGSPTYNITKPEQWSDGRIAMRLQGMVGAGIASINFLYGRDTGMLAYPQGLPTLTFADGYTLVHIPTAAYFPIRRMVGGGYSRELGFVPRIGGMNTPMLRLEGTYFWDSDFVNFTGTEFSNHDDLRLAGALEFGLPIRWLNPSALFRITGEYQFKHILNLEDGSENALMSTAGPVQKFNHISGLMLSTSYWANRINPVILWTQDWTNEAYALQAILGYTPSNAWAYSLTASFFGGSIEGQGFEPFDHKDNVSFKIVYKWG